MEDQFKGTYSAIGSLKERLILNASGSIVSMGLSENILVYNEKKQLSQALERRVAITTFQIYSWKFYRLPNFNMVFQLMLIQFFKSELFLCSLEVADVIN